MTISKDDLLALADKLTELLARATAGPWGIIEGDSVINISADGVPIVATNTKPYYRQFDATDEANATLIVETANALPVMIEALRARAAMVQS